MELSTLPKELRIERRLGQVTRSVALHVMPLVLLAPVVFLAEALPAAVGLIVITGLSLRELRRARADVLPHLERADSGDLDGAIDQLAALARGERDHHRKAFLLSLLAQLELRNGDPETALALARESVRHPHNNPAVQRALESSLAMILALGGELDEALETLPKSPLPDAVTDVHRLVIWARAGRFQEVADYKYKKLPLMDGLRHGNRVMALMKALALSRCDGGALRLQRALDEARPRVAGELDYLIRDWPELQELACAHVELSAPRTVLSRA